MNRRDFLKLLAAGATIPIVSGLPTHANSFEGPKTTNGLEGKELLNGNITIEGGDDELQCYYYVRVSACHEGREFHELFRIMDYEADSGTAARRLVQHINNSFKAHNINAAISEKHMQNAISTNRTSW